MSDNRQTFQSYKSPPEDSRKEQSRRGVLRANVCQSCGQQLYENMKFCWWCGEDIHIQEVGTDYAGKELPISAPELRVVHCAAPKCIRPVIGQCTGYKKDCRKYYCDIHSNDTLCYECTMRQFSDEEAERTKQDYLDTIQNIQRQARSAAWRDETVKWLGGISLALGFLGFLVQNSEAGPLFCGLGFFGLVAAFIALNVIYLRNEKSLATQIDQQKGGFLDFYNTWKKDKQKEVLRTIGAIVGFIFLAALTAALSESEDERIRKKVDNELRRRGM